MMGRVWLIFFKNKAKEIAIGVGYSAVFLVFGCVGVACCWPIGKLTGFIPGIDCFVGTGFEGFMDVCAVGALSLGFLCILGFLMYALGSAVVGIYIWLMDNWERAKREAKKYEKD